MRGTETLALPDTVHLGTPPPPSRKEATSASPPACGRGRGVGTSFQKVEGVAKQQRIGVGRRKRSAQSAHPQPCRKRGSEVKNEGISS
jgi:hypothetical protein